MRDDVKRDGIFAGADPFAIARAWLAEAERSEPNDPSAIALATVDADGLPNARMVLLKEIDSLRGLLREACDLCEEMDLGPMCIKFCPFDAISED